ncbi:hypothetical protein SaSA201_0544 [Streptococcus agalactiae]|nr:hypothetical protein SaSA20_0540 [Streptococcus agalactiae]AHN30167.1 hypothetical protein V193_03070 [Streptococcus agalactiae 138P]EJZ04131.1 hypothetical protein M3M_00475 [Streptococcus agalactiae STIR-CD-17]EPU02598.1 hypothetical protein SAG0123_01015 [Streptococcus agalactiae STIR-CD-13]EPU03842.1 hypothetical protein SAG0122_04840 [Streptococcus agalactiae STIR-CD-09]EPW81304.1 hypothetical protein SAG0121_00885 [Streptococcus agalactiae STIR-CD-07]
MSKLEQSSHCIVITHLMLIMGMESQGHTCIRFCEIDKFARASYQAIFETEGELEYHDITRITDDQPQTVFYFGVASSVDLVSVGVSLFLISHRGFLLRLCQSEFGSTG